MIDGLDYTLAYNEFLMKESFKQQHMINCISEAVAISEGVKPDLMSFNEGITDTIKEAWNKFVTFIHKIFAKFKATFDAIFDKDKAYMEKYAGIITRQPVKISVSVTNYNLQLMANTHAEVFNPSKIDTYKQGLQATLAASQLPNALKNYKGNDKNEFKEFVANQFCSGDIDGTIDEKALNMTDLYNFCHDFKDKRVHDLLEKDQRAIEKSGEQFNRIFNEVDKAAKDEANAKQEKTTTTGSGSGDNTGNGTTPTDAAKTAEGNKTATINGSYINLNTSFKSLSEKLDINTSSGGDDKRLGANGGAPNSSDDERYAKNAAGTTGTNSSDDQMRSGATGLTRDVANAIFTAYTNVFSTICSTKLTYTDSAYKDYMSIIHAHVNSYVGEKEGDKQIAAAGTNYNNNPKPAGNNEGDFREVK